ncbi:MAG: DUF6525 family protein [Alphaproteobacteria bacterium]
MSRYNSPAPTAAARRTGTSADEMQAYDMLPRPLRQRIGQQTVKISSAVILRMLAEGQRLEEVITSVDEYYREYMRTGEYGTCAVCGPNHPQSMMEIE